MALIKEVPPDPRNPVDIPDMDVTGISRKWLGISYTPDCPHPARELDIYLPEEGEGPFPTLIAIHGGAFWSGTKRDMQNAAYMEGLCDGFAVACVEQRLRTRLSRGGHNPDGLFPNPVIDFKAAIRFLRANAKKYSLAPMRFVACGASAGGYHSVMAAATANIAALYDGELGFDRVSDEVQAVVSWSGVGDLAIQSEYTRQNPLPPLPSEIGLELGNFADVFLGVSCREHGNLARFASPETWITDKMPPTLIWHGTDDEVVPVECSRRIARKIADVCGEDRVTFEEFPGFTHCDARFSLPGNISRMFGWLKKSLR